MPVRLARQQIVEWVETEQAKWIGDRGEIMRFAGLEKSKARDWVAHFFSKRTGLSSLCADRQFWELCCDQTGESSFHQYFNLGLFTPAQYFGVDLDKTIVENNRAAFAKAGLPANFIHGWWKPVTREYFSRGEFKPQLIFLDTESAYREAARDVAHTMELCPNGVILVVNMVTELVRQGIRKENSFTANDFLHALDLLLPAPVADLWKGHPESYPYIGDRNVKMLQIGMYKP